MGIKPVTFSSLCPHLPDWANLARANWRIFNFTFVGAPIDFWTFFFLAKINRARPQRVRLHIHTHEHEWLFKYLKVINLKANFAKLGWWGRCQKSEEEVPGSMQLNFTGLFLKASVSILYHWVCLITEKLECKFPCLNLAQIPKFLHLTS